MKKTFILFIFILLSSSIFAQLKIGYVDSETIMDQLPDAQDAQQRIDALIAEWQEELRNMENDWEKKFNDYENRKLIMSDQKRADVEKELIALENNISNFRQQKFGPTGELFEKQTELMEPVQNKIFNVIQDVAEEEELDFVFDLSGDIIFLYAKPEYDITALVLERLAVDEVIQN